MVSNCLIEAIKAKIKDPKNVRIIALKRAWNDGNLHFYWIDGNEVYHYEAPSSKAPFLFKGETKHISLESFEAFTLKHLAISKPNLDKSIVAKKLRLPSVNMIGMLNWEIYFPDGECFEKPVKNNLTKLVMVKLNSSEIKIMNIEDFEKENFECVYWKYLSPYCQEYKLFRLD